MKTEQQKAAENERYMENHMKNWRAWGSWFSWGSPVGLGIFWALILVSSGVFFWLWGHR